MSQNQSQPFLPKQATPRDAALHAELVGNFSDDSVAYVLKNFLHGIPSGATIHDNGCGDGTVTRTILANQLDSITIHGTDNSPQMLAAYKTAFAKHPFIHSELMAAEELTFPDETFSHSFTTFVLPGISDWKKAARHIHRTLRPQGVAVLMAGGRRAHDSAMIHTNAATRGSDAKLMYGNDLRTTSPWKEFLTPGGFKEEDIQEFETDFYHRVKDMKRFAQLLWSYLGMRAGGPMWTQEDEEKWDEAISLTMKGIEDSDMTERQEDGTWLLKFHIYTAIATKS